jgi:hypothetical protein
MLLREFGMHAEIAGQLGINDHPAGQAQGAKDVGQHVHGSRVPGVSVKLSGSTIILANYRFT